MIKKYAVPGGGAVTVPFDVLERLIGLPDPRTALLYMIIKRDGGTIREETASAELSVTIETLTELLNELSAHGLIEAEDTVELSGGRPTYGQDEVAEKLRGDYSFKRLYAETQRRLGKNLSPSDLNTLLCIYDWIGLPADVVSLLVSHMIDEARRKKGEGGRPSMREIERRAADWKKAGLTVTSDVCEYLARLDERRTLFGMVLQKLQIRGRSPSESEKGYISSWLDMGFGPEEIYRAYDKTVLGTGKLTWRYMNKILMSWHEQGLHILSEIDAADSPQKPSADAFKAPGDGERAAVDWLREYSENRKSAEG